MKDWQKWLREKVLFDGEGGAGAGASESGGGEGGAAGGGASAGGEGGEGGDGAGAHADGDNPPVPAFRQFIPEEFKDAPYWATIPDEATLVKNYANAQAMIGKKGIIPPGEGANAEAWQEFYTAIPKPADDAPLEIQAAYAKAMGVPDTVQGYDEAVVVPEDFPKEFLRQDLVDGYKEAALKAGLNPKSAKAILDWYMGAAKADLESLPATKEIAPGIFVNDSLFTENREKVVTALKAELGDTYDATLARVQAAVVRFGGNELVQYYDETGLGNHPATIKAWMNVVKAMSEDGTLDRGTNTSGANLQNQIDELAKNPALVDKHHVDHEKVTKQWTELHEKLHPNEEEE